MGSGSEPGGVAHVACRTPLVVLAQVETSDEAARLRARLLADHPRSLFIGVLCTDHPDAIGEIVRPLAPVVRELIFTDTLGLPLATGEELAVRALNELGVGQDFVYSVPRTRRSTTRWVCLQRRGGRGGRQTPSWLPGPQLPSSGPTATSNEPARHRPQADRGSVCRLLAGHGDAVFGDDYFADLFMRSPLGPATVPARVVAR